MTKAKKKAQPWATRMETATKPFLAQDKEQAFQTICNVLNKQNKLFSRQHTLTAEQVDIVNQQFGDFKDRCLQKLRKGEKVFDCAKQYHLMCHVWLMDKAKEWKHSNYLLYLESLWMKNALMGHEDKEGIHRLIAFVNHPNQRFNPSEVLQWNAPARDDLLPEQLEELLATDGMHTAESALDQEICDGRYRLEMLQDKARLLNKQKAGHLSSEDEADLCALNKALKEAFGKKTGKVYLKKGYVRTRVFKKREDNRNYACIAMSIKRAAKVFPDGSLERQLIDKNLVFSQGQFSWGGSGAT